MDLLSVNLFDLVKSLSAAPDLMNQTVTNHHSRVTYIAAGIASEMGLITETQQNLILGGLLHDVGAFSLKTRTACLCFDSADTDEHGENGFRLLKDLPGFSKASILVRYHHVPFCESETIDDKDMTLPCQILYLADRLCTLIHHSEPIFMQLPRILKNIQEDVGKKFSPQVAECFLELASREYFWLDMVSPCVSIILSEQFHFPDMNLNLDEMITFSRGFSKIIDFKSRFTAAHSCSVSCIAELLGSHLGFSDKKCQLIKIAGYFHDLGKLAVPSEILEKPERLTDQDYSVIKPHAYHTYRILKSVQGFDEIAGWAGFHHERLDGRGYPFHLTPEKISLEARIMAVADVFTAITENRPYRKGMSEDMVKNVLNNFVSISALDGDVVSVLLSHYSEIELERKRVQAEAREEYNAFRA
jgi:HD-GYP domain-containing protein (c-di-GMP phosphodiesterase class II)